MDIQIDYFTITRKQIDKLLGASQARDYLHKNSIFSITVGSNDFLNNYLLPVVSMGARIKQSPDAFVDDMISHLRAQLTVRIRLFIEQRKKYIYMSYKMTSSMNCMQRLYKLDARKFIVGNVGPIGCIPYQKTINQLSENECVALPNQLANQYNAKLKDLLQELNENLEGATLIHANVYDLVMELITNYAKYGKIISP